MSVRSSMRFALLGLLLASLGFCDAWEYPDTDVVIVSNNDVNPSNPNRASALYLKSSFSCSEAQQACGSLSESLLPAPNGTAGLTAQNLSVALASEKHGTSLDPSQPIWIAGQGGCSIFTPSYAYAPGAAASSAGSDQGGSYPALCTNSAPFPYGNTTTYDTSRQIELQTPNAGILQGFRDKYSWRFLGVKYGEPTSGAARFQPPVPISVNQSTVRSALNYGPFCSQPPDADNGHILWTGEDCLQLNIFTPVVRTGSVPDYTAPKLPVMFYIHGGGLNTGDSGPFPYNMTTSGYVGPSISNMLDGTNVVSYGGVVLVSINYRLNAHGWFNASNAALKDAILALHWVQDNIDAFGGDPKKVLIYGESAGGTMTRYLLGTNPKYTEGLFSAAILESDFGNSNQFFSPRLSDNTSLALAIAAGCAPSTTTTYTNEIALCVQALPAANITMASFTAGLSWDITIDGDYVLNDIASSIVDGVYGRVPTIWATNQCEYCYFLPTTISPTSNSSIFPDSLGLLFNSTEIQAILDAPDLWPYQTAPSDHGISGAVLQLGQLITDYEVHCPDANLAALETNTTNPGNAYKVLFGMGLGSPLTPNPATCPGQVCHADELYFVFATAEVDNLYQPLTPTEVAITQDVISRWTTLAWTGNPNYEGALVEWPPYTGDDEVVINATTTVQPYHVAQCDFIKANLGFVYGLQ